MNAPINSIQPLRLRNAEAAPLESLPLAEQHDFLNWVKDSVQNGCRILSLFTLAPGSHAANTDRADKQDSPSILVAVLADDYTGRIMLMGSVVEGSYPALTPDIPQAHIFERLLYEEEGILPHGHPWLKPVRFSRTDGPDVGIMDFYRVDGQEVHEVAVGPVHAGVIECGHFRFQCLGEEVMHLEISLGYHHRGLDTLLAGGPNRRTLPLMETVAGDSTIAHTWAACSVLEALMDASVSPQGQIIRSLALELERLANHTGDLGALSMDAGFLPTASYCGRLRGDWLNTTAMLCGNRFGRGLVRPGGTVFALDHDLVTAMRHRFHEISRDVNGAVNLLWHSSSFVARVSDIGTISQHDAHELGLVGLAARACALLLDSRHTHPLSGLPLPPEQCSEKYGDVHARTLMRQKEINASVAYCQRLLDVFLKDNPEVCLHQPLSAPAANSLAVALVEGWRGEVCHVAVTDNNGQFSRYRITDPSVHNWMGLAMALRGQQISDFPLCNKSFNLSYCGHDL